MKRNAIREREALKNELEMHMGGGTLSIVFLPKRKKQTRRGFGKLSWKWRLEQEEMLLRIRS